MSKNVTIYTGTFTKINGEKRTMSFIRKGDLPSSMVNEDTIKNLEDRTGSEVVFDTENRQFRQFNWNTVQGDVTETSSTFTFQQRSVFRKFPIKKLLFFFLDSNK